MKYKISKKKVIEALLTEPLGAGSFFDSPSDTWTKDDGKCGVCAVGAILRAVKPKFFNISQGYRVTNENCSGFEASRDRAWDSSNFMAILSTEFEYAAMENAAEDYGNKDFDRFHAIMIAEGMCPDVLEFEV